MGFFIMNAVCAGVNYAALLGLQWEMGICKIMLYFKQMTVQLLSFSVVLV